MKKLRNKNKNIYTDARFYLICLKLGLEKEGEYQKFYRRHNPVASVKSMCELYAISKCIKKIKSIVNPILKGDIVYETTGVKSVIKCHNNDGFVLFISLQTTLTPDDSIYDTLALQVRDYNKTSDDKPINKVAIATLKGQPRKPKGGESYSDYQAYIDKYYDTSHKIVFFRDIELTAPETYLYSKTRMI